jgi:hypothetical protein
VLTTFLNPTIWLLIALGGATVLGTSKGWSARQTFDASLRIVTRLPVLIALCVLAAGGAASRFVLGYMAPGTYAEEVLAARAFLSNQRLYVADDRLEFERWVTDERGAVAPWTLPGLSACRAGAVTDRPRFYSAQAHSPALLLASVPVVVAVGGRGLYVALSLLSLLSIAAIVSTLGFRAGLTHPSRVWVLLAAAVLGWQPVLAGLRQGDAVLAVAGLVVLSWVGATHRRRVPAGVALGVAAAANIPLILSLPAFFRRAPAISLTAAACCAGLLLSAMSIAGLTVARDFADGALGTAALYAEAPLNYAVSGRLLTRAGASPAALAAIMVTFSIAAVIMAGEFGRALGAVTVVAVLFSPVAWSQHLALAVVALAVAFGCALRRGRTLALAVWIALALPLSLPDGGVAALQQAFDAVAGAEISRVLPLPTLALAACGAWLMLPAPRPVMADGASVHALTHEPVSHVWRV